MYSYHIKTEVTWNPLFVPWMWFITSKKQGWIICTDCILHRFSSDSDSRPYAVAPSRFEKATIIPAPKKKSSTDTSLNDYPPVTLTPIIMKCLKRLVKDCMTLTLPPSVDSPRSACRPKLSDWGQCAVCAKSLEHLEKHNTHVRMLFVDFRSSFNTEIPQQPMSTPAPWVWVPPPSPAPMCCWILDLTWCVLFLSELLSYTDLPKFTKASTSAFMSADSQQSGTPKILLFFFSKAILLIPK